MTGFGVELRHATRALARRPSFTLIAAGTLALGIGATTAMFSAVYNLLIVPLPFDAADRMAYVWWASGEGGMMVAPRTAAIDAWSGELRTIAALEPFSRSELTLLAETGPEVISGARITATLPATLGVRVVLGRNFLAEEMVAGGRPVAMIGTGLWRARYGARPEVLGETLRLESGSPTIVGVVDDRLGGFSGIAESTDVWLPLVRDAATQWVNALVVLREGATRADAESELRLLSAGVELANPTDGDWGPKLMTAADMLGTTTRDALLVLFAAVVTVLLIACANVAGLMVVRTGSRGREIAVRAALGAGRRRLLGTVLAETAVIAVVGGAFGLLLGAWLIEAVRAVRPPDLQELALIGLDPAVLAFATLLCIGTALLFGIAPAALVGRHELSDVLKASGGGSSGSAQAGRARALLVGGQIALSVVLLVGATLLVRSVLELRHRDVGFDAGNVLVAGIDLPPSRYATTPARRAFAEQLVERLAALPDVEAAAATTGLPPRFGMIFGALEVEDGQSVAGAGAATPGAMVGPAYFRTLGIPFVEGRPFEGPDDDGVIINASLARAAWPDESALGKRIRIGTGADRWTPVVGVVRDVRTSGPAGALDRPQVYHPFDFDFGDFSIVIRRRGGAAIALAPAVRAAVRQIDPQLPVRDIATGDGLIADAIARNHFFMALLVAFAVLALTLSAVGLYGVITETVARRTREIGIRVALGARPAAVRALLLAQGARMTLIGAAAGIVLAFALTRLLRGLLFGVEPADPLSFAGAVFIASATTALATIIPARRATRVDPLTALRAD